MSNQHLSTGGYAGLRASGKKADLALVVADKDAVVGGTFTTNVMCAAPVLYCKEVLARKKTVRAVSHRGFSLFSAPRSARASDAGVGVDSMPPLPHGTHRRC